LRCRHKAFAHEINDVVPDVDALRQDEPVLDGCGEGLVARVCQRSAEVFRRDCATIAQPNYDVGLWFGQLWRDDSLLICQRINSYVRK
jgi:hypothetical protein